MAKILAEVLQQQATQRDIEQASAQGIKGPLQTASWLILHGKGLRDKRDVGYTIDLEVTTQDAPTRIVLTGLSSLVSDHFSAWSSESNSGLSFQDGLAYRFLSEDGIAPLPGSELNTTKATQGEMDMWKDMAGIVRNGKSVRVIDAKLLLSS